MAYNTYKYFHNPSVRAVHKAFTLYSYRIAFIYILSFLSSTCIGLVISFYRVFLFYRCQIAAFFCFKNIRHDDISRVHFQGEHEMIPSRIRLHPIIL